MALEREEGGGALFENRTFFWLKMGIIVQMFYSGKKCA